MKIKLFYLVVLVFLTVSLQAQQYDDYLGAGHHINVTVTTSSNDQTATGFNTISGLGMMPDMESAGRFLQQASLGADYETIDALSQMSLSAWIEDQFTQDDFDFLTHLDDTLAVYALDWHLAQGEDPDDFGIWSFFRPLWWESVMTGDDLLRDRIAFALSEIFVISSDSDLYDFTEGVTDYYDMLHNGAFGNFRDLLFDVTMHPTMGNYLSHLNNPKEDPSVNLFPDENYAREIMQLFTIGLYELNNDGTRVLDFNGDPIPTYGQDDIREMAKVFTGLGPQKWSRHVDPADSIMYGTIQFGDCLWCTDLTVPMKMFEDYHEPGAKTLLNGYTIPAGQTGMQDINQAIDLLFNHPNVGPFFGRFMIQRLVKSNPTPQYINRVANAFNDNGSGVRGDMKAIIKAVLLDPEARDCSWIDVADHGMLKEPIVRYTQTMRAFNASNSTGRHYNRAWSFITNLYQHPMESPSVFNFFLPDYQPLGPIADLDLVAPEFQLFNSASALSHVNASHHWGLWDYVFDEEPHYFYPDTTVTIPDHAYTGLDISDEMALITQHWPSSSVEIDALLDRLNLLLCYGNMSAHTREVIRASLIELGADDLWTARFGIYYTLMSPDYSVLK